ncbi:MAG: GNAT family N-acetyltransferase [Kribbellaceae bacterium]|nr:GNAT family N-acetyltransferase [Kribbellaceae bacterium]
MIDCEELVRRWQAGWSASRGWTRVVDDNGILTVRIGEEDRAMEFVVLDPDAHPERLKRAADLALDSKGTAWVTLATLDREGTEDALMDLGLDVERDPEWLMTIELSQQPALQLHPRYALVSELEENVIVTRATLHGAVASSGRMAVVGTDAVADRIETDPGHRRRGLGSAVMAALVEAAEARGATRGILIASRDGQRLYRSLGWKKVADIVVARAR